MNKATLGFGASQPFARWILKRLDRRAMPLLIRLTDSLIVERFNGAMRDSTLVLVLSSILVFGYLLSFSTDQALVGDCIPYYLLLVVSGPIGIILLAILPWMVTGLAAAIPVADTQSDTLPLLQLTLIAPKSIQQTYRMAAAYRLRKVLGWSFGVIPLIAAGLTFWSFIFGSTLIPYGLTEQSFILLFLPFAFWLIVTFSFWGVNLAGLILGASLGMQKNLPIHPSATSLVLGLPHIFSMIVVLVLSIRHVGGYSYHEESKIMMILLFDVVALSLPYLAAFGSLKLLTRHQEVPQL